MIYECRQKFAIKGTASDTVRHRGVAARDEELAYKRTVRLSYLLEVERALLVFLRMFSLERSTAGAFAVHFRMLS